MPRPKPPASLKYVAVRAVSYRRTRIIRQLFIRSNS